VPASTRTTKLPGIAATAYENDQDPIKLVSYSFGSGDNQTLYTRKSNGFVKSEKYQYYSESPDGGHALGIAQAYSSDGYDIESLVDLSSGEVYPLKTVKKPEWVGGVVRWSPDGKYVMVSVLHEVKGKNVYKGFVLIDRAAHTAEVVQVKDTEIGIGPFIWGADSQSVATWAGENETGGLRYFDLKGKALRTLSNLGDPGGSYHLSPSGKLLLINCAGEAGQVCVRTAEGQPYKRVSFNADDLIGWYDENHFAAWRRKSNGAYEAVVVDLEGKSSRVLTTMSGKAYLDSYFVYVRVE
jgi:hypothetical protein